MRWDGRKDAEAWALLKKLLELLSRPVGFWAGLALRLLISLGRPAAVPFIQLGHVDPSNRIGPYPRVAKISSPNLVKNVFVCNKPPAMDKEAFLFYSINFLRSEFAGYIGHSEPQKSTLNLNGRTVIYDRRETHQGRQIVIVRSVRRFSNDSLYSGINNPSLSQPRVRNIATNVVRNNMGFEGQNQRLKSYAKTGAFLVDKYFDAGFRRNCILRGGVREFDKIRIVFLHPFFVFTEDIGLAAENLGLPQSNPEQTDIGGYEKPIEYYFCGPGVVFLLGCVVIELDYGRYARIGRLLSSFGGLYFLCGNLFLGFLLIRFLFLRANNSARVTSKSRRMAVSLRLAYSKTQDEGTKELSGKARGLGFAQ